MTKVLVLGSSGMLGNAVTRVMAESSDLKVWCTARSRGVEKVLPEEISGNIRYGVNALDPDALTALLEDIRPDLVINCVGLVKQLSNANDPLEALPINAILPHRLARLCALAGARLIHVSTDCVFSGAKGNYVETDDSDAKDLYGRSKYLGEVDYPNAITLRTSIIGHELSSSHGLIGWFLSQSGKIKGFTRAIFSGLPTVELARVMRDVVLPRPELHGVFHVAAAPISKYDLLRLVNSVYNKSIEILPDDKVTIDRSLNAERFEKATGYVAPAWLDLIKRMHEFR